MNELFAGGTGSIASFGTKNPQVAEFLKATFALEGMQIQNTQIVSSPSASPVVMPTSGMSR